MDVLTCNQCSARLEVAPTTNYVTCARCNTLLQIKRTDTAKFTEVIGPAEEGQVTGQPWPSLGTSTKTRKFLADADVALEEELNKIDREWSLERERYLLASEFGAKHVPSKKRGLVVGGVLVALAVGLYFLFASLKPTLATEVGPLISGFILLAGLMLGWYQYSKGVEYERAHEVYQTRRNAAIEQYRHR